MKWPRPFYSVGVLYRIDSADVSFLGTCFAYRTKSHFLTAAHCVDGLQGEQIGITLPLIDHGGFIRLLGITPHPSADLAILETAPVVKEELAPFIGVDPMAAWGWPVNALGYPEDAGENPDEGLDPTARYFSGHIQRMYTHQSKVGAYRYPAGELSFGAPAGLSGGPVFGATDHYCVLGVAAENRDSFTYLRRIEEVREPGMEYKHHESEVIRYGIFVHLQPLSDWLKAQIP